MSVSVNPYSITSYEDSRLLIDLLQNSQIFTVASLAYTASATMDQYTLPEKYLPVSISGDPAHTSPSDLGCNVDLAGAKGALAGLCACTKTFNSLISLAGAIDAMTGTIGVAASPIKTTGNSKCKMQFSQTRVGQLVGTGQSFPLFDELYKTVANIDIEPTLWSPGSQVRSKYTSRSGLQAPMPPEQLLVGFLQTAFLHGNTESYVSLFTTLRAAVLGSAVTDVTVNPDGSFNVIYTTSFQAQYNTILTDDTRQNLTTKIIPDVVVGWLRHVTSTGKRVTEAGGTQFQYIDPDSAYAKLMSMEAGTQTAMNYPDGSIKQVDLAQIIQDSMTTQDESLDFYTDSELAFLPGSGALVTEIQPPTYTRNFADADCPKSEMDATCLQNAGQLGLISQYSKKERGTLVAFFGLDAKAKKKKYSITELTEGSSAYTQEINAALIPKFRDKDQPFKDIAQASVDAWLKLFKLDLAAAVANAHGYAFEGQTYYIMTEVVGDVEYDDPQTFCDADTFINSSQAPDMFPTALARVRIPLIIPAPHIKTEPDGEVSAVTQITIDSESKYFNTFAAYHLGDLFYDRKTYIKLLACEHKHNMEAYLNRVKSDGGPADDFKKKPFPWWILLVIAIPLVAALIVSITNGDEDYDSQKSKV